MPGKGQKIGENQRASLIASNKIHKRKWPEGSDRKSRLYRCWMAIKHRHRRSHEAYERYKDKPVCEEWKNYGNFMRWALGNGYAENLVIDRIDNAKGYYPENCRWVTMQQSARNRTNSVFATAFGETKLLVEWAEDARCKVRRALLYKRLAAGWPTEVALLEPSQGQGRPRPIARARRYALGSLGKISEAARRARLANPRPRGANGQFL